MSHEPRQSRVIVFDLGGVVVRICRTWEEACERAGVPVRDMARFREPAFAAERKRLTLLHQTGRIACAEYFDAIARQSGGLYTPDEVRRVHDIWIIEDYPRIADLICGLGPRTACLSNTNDSHWRMMLRGRPEYAPSEAVAALRHHLVSHELAAAKPGEEIYTLAEQRLEATPDSIVFFDDTEENVAAARARGWNAHLIDPLADPAEQIREVLARTLG